MSGRILFVDDEEQIRKLVAAFLGRRGYELALYDNGREAFEAATAEVPDLVITDLNMPVMDGIELIRQLRGHPATVAVRVIVMTATKSLADETREEIGADAYLVKPVQLAVLGQVVEEVLGIRI